MERPRDAFRHRLAGGEVNDGFDLPARENRREAAAIVDVDAREVRSTGARRNSIIGPGSKVFDMAFTKIFPIKEARVLEFRAQATNIFNIPNYSAIDTTVNSPTFGRVTSIGAMRQFTMTSRFRF